MSQNDAVWIWYPGDFEIWLHVLPGAMKSRLLYLTLGNPTLFMSKGNTIRSDESWEASCYNGQWLAAAYWRFSDPSEPPSQFRLADRPERPVLIERTKNGFLADFGKEPVGGRRIE
jgi:hypothetical protein